MRVSALFAVSILSLSTSFVANAVDNAGNSSEKHEKTSDNYNLILVGGGLSTCSSYSQSNCHGEPFSASTKQQSFYQINENTLRALLKSPPFLQQPEAYRHDFERVIKNIYAKQKNKVLSSEALGDAFARINFTHLNGSVFYQELPDALYYAMLDFFEMPQTDDKGNRKKEVTSLEHNLNPHSTAIYRRFVDMARSRLNAPAQKPKVAVITASSRDPFEVADFYTSVFEDAGAEVIWLPLDKTYQQARALENKGLDGCSRLNAIRADNGSFNREAIYPLRTALQQQYCQQPQQLLQQLSTVQGIFFNGGDQSLTLASLLTPEGKDSIELKRIKQRLQAGELVVGGTSAGTAVQSGGVFEQRPVPMISNGDSATAFARGPFATPPPSIRCSADNPCQHGLQGGDLTYRARGGSGLFTLGIMDTHFSERNREARLALLSTYTGTRFGFGVDEATALMVNTNSEPVQMEVIGQGGVFISDSKSGIYKLQDGKRQLVASSHFLNHGDKLTYAKETGELTFELAGKAANEVQKVEPPLKEGVWRRLLSHNCGTREPLNWTLDKVAYVTMPTEDTRFAIGAVAGEPRCSYTHLAFGAEN
ncbi:cyanophycinase [Lacimicrobium sp. SS2-24]|uniref:cyanophycinase n=1 Tax=Lacimicrobium sp. SS2-24 TaxID=2005569 RepID=UPI000B4AC9DA|nr:cyanophycinase [Lacimicrobium sp. SS2-24]